jgi:hypothetical protein
MVMHLTLAGLLLCNTFYAARRLVAREFSDAAFRGGELPDNRDD